MHPLKLRRARARLQVAAAQLPWMIAVVLTVGTTRMQAVRTTEVETEEAM